MAVTAILMLRRLAYRLAYRVLQVQWFLMRPHKQGVKCLVTDRDRVLLVRHTYGHRAWDLPGGSIKRRESPLTAARREMIEELGLDGAQWAPFGELHGTVDHRRDTIHCFRAEVQQPQLRLDHGELEVARWFPRAELPEDVGPYVGAIIARVPASAGGA
jgi:8-oxo-dGTP pyrophosphatase MutT (NUDIX family)